MQEGILSLMQMPRTTIAVQTLREARLPYIVVLTDPTTGGVTASYAMLGDIHIAEPGALICFAGPRVIQQTIREQLPEGFQRAEYLLAHGMIDMVVHRHKLRETLAAPVPSADRRRRRAREAAEHGQAAQRHTQLCSTAASVDGKTDRDAGSGSATSIEAEPLDDERALRGARKHRAARQDPRRRRTPPTRCAPRRQTALMAAGASSRLPRAILDRRAATADSAGAG